VAAEGVCLRLRDGGCTGQIGDIEVIDIYPESTARWDVQDVGDVYICKSVERIRCPTRLPPVTLYARVDQSCMTTKNICIYELLVV